MKRFKQVLMIIVAIFLLPSVANAADRDIQIRKVNFESSVVEIYNFGTVTESLSGWRFCSHNTSMTLNYSGPGGLNGISLSPGSSLFLHYNNDAIESNEINISSLGGQFATLERNAYGLQLYFTPVVFFNGNTIADHLQWSIGGVDNFSADERSDEAENGGVWEDQSEWIAVTADTSQIDLVDLSGGVLHSPDDYMVTEPSVNVPMMPIVSLSLLSLLIAYIVRSSRV